MLQLAIKIIKLCVGVANKLKWIAIKITISPATSILKTHVCVIFSHNSLDNVDEMSFFLHNWSYPLGDDYEDNHL